MQFCSDSLEKVSRALVAGVFDEEWMLLAVN
jgi:hypothetical protein